MFGFGKKARFARELHHQTENLISAVKRYNPSSERAICKTYLEKAAAVTAIRIRNPALMNQIFPEMVRKATVDREEQIWNAQAYAKLNNKDPASHEEWAIATLFETHLFIISGKLDQSIGKKTEDLLVKWCTDVLGDAECQRILERQMAKIG